MPIVNDTHMPYAPLYIMCPDTGFGEIRAITVTDSAPKAVPRGQYGLVPMFCDEAGCDCRRVMLNIMHGDPPESVGVVAFGWENEGFYAKWMGVDNLSPQDKVELMGPSLNMASKQTPIINELMPVICAFLKNPSYVDLLKKQYIRFRKRAEQLAMRDHN